MKTTTTNKSCSCSTSCARATPLSGSEVHANAVDVDIDSYRVAIDELNQEGAKLICRPLQEMVGGLENGPSAPERGPVQSSRPMSELSRSEGPCGNSSFDLDRVAFDVRTLRAIVGIRTEVVLDDSDDDRCARRERRLRKLKIVDGLESVCFETTEDPCPQPSPVYGPRPQAGSQPTTSTRGHDPNPPAHTGARLKFDYSTKPAWDCSYRADPNGNCWGDSRVENAFWLAYKVIWSANNELNKWYDLDISKRRYLWDRGQLSPSVNGVFRAAPSYWFGSADSPNFSDRFSRVRQTISGWLYCFRHGFYGDGIHQPVLIRCHPNEDTGNVAYHWEPNVVTLCETWYELGPKNRAMILLHEMGHFSAIAVPKAVDWWMPWLAATFDPKDRSNNGCDGWPWPSQNKCYQGYIDHASQMFIGGNPKILVNLFEGGDLDAQDDMLGNIDNYVSWMWNRWQDHDWPALVL